MKKIKLVIAVLVILFVVSAFGCGRKTAPVYSMNNVATGLT